MRTLLIVSLCFVPFLFLAQQQSLELNPSSDLTASGVNIGDLDISGNKITLEALINMKFMATDTLGHAVLSKFSTNSDMNYVLRTMRFAIATDVDGYVRLTHAYPIQPNRWYHIAGVYDGSYVRFYVNGCMVKEQAHTGNLKQNDFDAIIGARPGNMGNVIYRGQIDEVRIWNVARTEAQIRANMGGSVPNTSPGLKGYYKFDGNYNNSAQNLYHGTTFGPEVARITRTGTMPSDFSITSATATPNPLPCAGSTVGAITINATPSTDASYSKDGALWQVHPNNVLNGYGAGTHTVYAKSAEGCVKTTTVTITAPPLAVAGGASVSATNVCQGSTLNLTLTGSTGNIQWQVSTDGGITWSDIFGATLAGSIVTASTAGSVQYRAYVTSGGCPPAISNVVSVVVDPNPSAGTISGATAICADGNPITYTASQPGGTWSTSNTGIATVNTFGHVLGNANGTVTLTYTVPGSGSCLSVATTFPINVYALSIAGTASTSSVAFCAGDDLSLLLTGHTGAIQWESSTDGGSSYMPIAGATTTPYAINNLTASTTHYQATVQNGMCPAVVSNDVVVTVHPIPDPGTISGADEVCEGSTITLMPTQIGGSWASNDLTIATVKISTGIATGVGEGTAMVVYTVTQNGCSDSVSKSIVVYPLPNTSISGDPVVCLGNQNLLTAPTDGGTWSSDDTEVATVLMGVVNGLSAGTATISYTATTTQGCTNSNNVTVTVISTDPPILTGASDLCLNQQDSITADVASGTWTSSDTLIATIDPSTGMLTALTPGTITLTYLITMGNCTAVNTKEVAVHDYPDPGTLNGMDSICQEGITSFFPSVANGEWHLQDTTIAQVDAQGNILGLLAGSTTVVYVVTSNVGCVDSVLKELVVKPLPNPGMLSGPDTLCLNSVTTLTYSVGDGSWASSDETIAIVASDGVIGTVSTGNVVITYTVTENGCSSDVSKAIVVIATNAGAISGTSPIVEGDSTQFIATWPNGIYTTNDPNLVFVNDSTGMVTALNHGTATIVYSVTNQCGTASTTSEIEITKLFRGYIIPQVISPNGDGLNDSWILDFLDDFPNNAVYVYNRWGTKVFEQKNYNNSVAFVGKANVGKSVSQELPNSTYFYIIDLNSDHTELLKGYLEVHR